jgi:hypothetical protein
MSISFIPKFSNIFPDQAIPDLNELMSDVPSRLVIGILSYINGILYLNESIEEQEQLFSKMIERLERDEITEIFKNYDDFIIKYPRSELYIFPLYTLLQLIEWEVINYRRIDFKNSTAQQELKILKAILIFNEKLDNSHINRGEAKDKSEALYKLMWENSLPQLEFTGRRLFFNQFLLGIEFIDYLEQNHPKHLKFYFKYLNITNKEDIFKGILKFLINGYNKEIHEYRNNFPVEIITKNKLLEPLVLDLESIDIEDYTKKEYNKFFKGLRRWPLLKHNQDTFDVVNWNFISDRMTTNALIFDFYQNSTIKKEIQFPDFKSEIGSKFSEKEAFVTHIKNTFINPKYKHLTSDENGSILIDYYLRLDNMIVLIEYKDYVVPDTIKNGDYEQIKEYFITNLIKSKTGRAKGVLQLINQIDVLNKDCQSIEDFSTLGIDKTRLIIFPVIITKDHSFTVPGLNDYLNKFFKKETKSKDYSFFLIEDLTLIDLKSFMDWSDTFIIDKQTLPSLLHKYHLKISYHIESKLRDPNSRSVLDCIASFSHLMIPENKNIITETAAFKEIVKRLKLEKK